MRRSAKLAATTLATVVAAAVVVGCTSGYPADSPARPDVVSPARLPMPTASLMPQSVRNVLRSPLGSTGAQRPNIVFVLTDDLSNNLVPYMPHVLAMQRAGMTFTNYTVTDSLCCPSRSSIFTGRFPHDTRVFDNAGPYGGFQQFYRRGEEQSTFATALQASGYRTAMLGKYLNGYQATTSYVHSGPAGQGPTAALTDHVPPGWTTWDGIGGGYREFGYNVNENRAIVHYGNAAADYGVDVLGRLGSSFIDTSAAAHVPFFMEVSTFAPHEPFVPAPQDAHKFPNLRAPRTPAFNRLPKNAPAWLAHHARLKLADIRRLDQAFRLRVRSVQSVDRMIGNLEAELQRTGQANNTVFVFSSDNGLHLGDYTLRDGKLTAFDTDVNVPLIVTGPRIPAQSVNTDLVQNVDLAPTFESLAGLTPPASVDGHSFTPLLLGLHMRWRSAGLIEHLGPDLFTADPDYQSFVDGNPPSYHAIRTTTYTYVRYLDGDHEYYNRVRDPWELDNIYGTLSAHRRAALDRQLNRLLACHTGVSCWKAALPRV